MAEEPADLRSRLAAVAPPVLGAWLAAVILIADQLTKVWIMYGVELPLRVRIDVLPFFDLTFVQNRGVSFGMLQADGLGRWLLVAFSLAVAGFLAWWLRTVERRLLAVSLGLIIGGAIGNVIDRVTRGYVIDFLDFSALYFPYVFNIADAAISIGVALLAYDAIRHRDAPPA